MQTLFIGVDVAKDWLDVHHPGRGARRIDNAPAAARAVAKACATEGAWVIDLRGERRRRSPAARGAGSGQGPLQPGDSATGS